MKTAVGNRHPGVAVGNEKTTAGTPWPTSASRQAGSGRDHHDLWVFAYGSLMWRPGFRYEEARRARLTGYSRRFCIYSVHHRGTPERLGLVLGLDRGGVCEGVAYRIAAPDVARTASTGRPSFRSSWSPQRGQTPRHHTCGRTARSDTRGLTPAG
jgi:hypothetical protein